MISKNINRKHILSAINEIDENGVPKNRCSAKFDLVFKDKFYPPKYVVSLAHKYANGKELPSNKFSGGDETNDFLTNLGFIIRDGNQTVDTKPEHIKINHIVTAIIEGDNRHTNESRLQLLKKLLELVNDKVETIILPAGFLEFKGISQKAIQSIEDKVVNLLTKANKKLVVCFGLDVENQIHQLGVAISNKGILSIGRKFYPTKEEKHKVVLADPVFETEFGYDRIFEFNKKRYFIAVCYDSFGIKNLKLASKNIDYIINVIHGFNPKGEGGSGDVYFAKHGLAGASKQWNCPAFGSAVFINRKLPINWQSGIMWTKGNISTKYWKYEDNPISPINVEYFTSKSEKVILRYFAISST